MEAVKLSPADGQPGLLERWGSSRFGDQPVSVVRRGEIAVTFGHKR